MMIPSGPHSPGGFGNWKGWRCDRCSKWNELEYLICQYCQYRRQLSSEVVKISVDSPSAYGPHGVPSSLASHMRAERVFRVGVWIAIPVIIIPLVLMALHFLSPSSASSGQIGASAGHQGGDTLYKGESFNPVDDYLLSANGRYELKFQHDGNLVEYDRGDHTKPLWASNTANKGGTIAILQPDGNFVIYAGKGYAPFSTGTNRSRYGTSGDRLVMRNNGTIVIYDDRNQVLWQAGP